MIDLDLRVEEISQCPADTGQKRVNMDRTDQKISTQAARGDSGSVQGGGWQSIATAPRDETIVLVFGVWAGEINGPDKEPDIYLACWQGGSTDYPEYTWNVIGTDGYAAWVKPTHWMPLPNPPSALREG